VSGNGASFRCAKTRPIAGPIARAAPDAKRASRPVDRTGLVWTISDSADRLARTRASIHDAGVRGRPAGAVGLVRSGVRSSEAWTLAWLWRYRLVTSVSTASSQTLAWDEQQLRTVGALLSEEHGREMGSDRVPRTLARRPSRAPAAGRPGRSLAGAEPLSGRTRVGRQSAARMRSPMPRSLSSGSIGVAVASSRRMRAPARAQPRSRRGRGPCPLRPARRAAGPWG
jgi:hypothetical protein